MDSSLRSRSRGGTVIASQSIGEQHECTSPEISRKKRRFPYPKSLKQRKFAVSTLVVLMFIVLIQKFHGNTRPRRQFIRRDVKGAILNRPITSITIEDLHLGDEHILETQQLETNMTVLRQERKEFLEILNDAGVEEIDADILKLLPTSLKIEQLYGKGPIVYGMDTCALFRSTVSPEQVYIGVAGMFNSGTNALSQYLYNCNFAANLQQNLQYKTSNSVPWGKHQPASRKWSNTANHFETINKSHVLPVVLIREPYSWMQSMCRHSYGAQWHHTKQHCPNLVPNQDDKQLWKFFQHASNIPIRIQYDEPNKPKTKFDSLAHVWTEWYGEYFSVKYPRLMVRFEDLIYHPRELTQQICTCAGGTMSEDFTYVVDSSKVGGSGHNEDTNLISAMIKYGSDRRRFHNMTLDDLAYARKALDPELIRIFQYSQPEQ